MAKNLIIGVCSNYKYDDVKPWVKSSKDCGFEGDVVLVTIDMDEETNNQIEKDGVIVIRAKKQSNMKIHMERFYHIHKYISEHSVQYDWVISTDVRDVIFQTNPSEWLEFQRHDVISSGEAIQIKHEHWNRHNIIKNFEDYFYTEIETCEVQCVGVLAGMAYAMKQLSFYIYQMSLNRPDWVADQAAYNMIIHRHPWKQITEFTTLSSAWAINGHVTNYEPDMEKFGPHLLEPRPTVKDNLIVNKNETPFCIVHQYDRVREWKKIVEDKYGVKIKSQYTPDIDNDMIVINTGV
jgi:hypothetical protein